MALPIVDIFGASALIADPATNDARLVIFYRDLKVEGWNNSGNLDLQNGERWLAGILLKHSKTREQYNALPQATRDEKRIVTLNGFGGGITQIANANYRSYTYNTTIYMSDANAIDPDIDLI